MLKKLAAYISLGILAAFVIHQWVANPYRIKRLLYSFEAIAAESSIRCSNFAPHWMPEALEYAISSGGALANQLAYISPEGNLYHCESGWMGSTLFSSRVSVDSRFRYASLTKVFTVDSILRGVNTGDIDLNDRIVDILSISGEVADSRINRITVRNLLEHSGGLIEN
ncbi:serine hydrolase domain-containing protein [Microbulbifer sp. VAAF005]|uniref:serine hydrolase domain-containing protein n=1 Tax=Microbulbifer sp. VAAF005 TaxID=3034230 RepID=UPI0024ADD6FE|nr:serine hydrolase domain-containing protein [Microbulbifer sp. VAAF005]WHI48268.1 serine hydrolase [Microbulbifer sp. VAAF005]